MVTLTPFYDKEHFGNGFIYAVNNINPEVPRLGYETSRRTCPHCNTISLFRFYDLKESIETDTSYIDIYDCKCPMCEKEFEVINKCSKEEDIDDVEYEYDFQCDETEELLMDYAAYIRTDSEDGYLYFMQAEKESLIYLTDEIENADFLDKDFLINEIKKSNYSNAKVEIIRRDRVIKTSYEVEE